MHFLRPTPVIRSQSLCYLGQGICCIDVIRVIVVLTKVEEPLIWVNWWMLRAMWSLNNDLFELMSFHLGASVLFFFFSSYRFSDRKTWFLEISSYPLNPLGCCDVRNYPCQSSWLSLSQTRHSKIVPFPLVIQCMLPALSNVIMSKKLWSRGQNRLSSKLIKIKCQNPLLAQGRPWEGSSYYVFMNKLLCIICKLDSFTFFFLKGSPPTWISFNHHPKPLPILAKSL